MAITTRPSEFGRRWNAKVPRDDIKGLLARTHVSTPWAVIESKINLAMDSAEGFSPALRRQTLAFARLAWTQVLTFFNRVMG